jgi:hypothetical protein
MNEVVGKVVRAEVDRLLRIDYSGKPVCVDCLAGKIPAGSGPPFTRIEVRRAVREMTQSPGSLDYLRSFLSHLRKEEGRASSPPPRNRRPHAAARRSTIGLVDCTEAE